MYRKPTRRVQSYTGGVRPLVSGENLSSLIELLIGLIAALHIYFLILEMFLWTKPFGLKVFKQSAEQAKASQVLAANQGLYNGFLAAGLIWSLAYPESATSVQLKIFFLLCVLVAGIFGGATVGRKIWIIQALPALIALVLIATHL
jgi:putative membrane protein